ncbi:MAG TPA: MFS transporter [Chloroflexota bacterium]|nr:MFS transporter [Chloroflexota bacterium]
MNPAPPPDTLAPPADAPAPTPVPSLADEPSPVRGVSRNVFLLGLVSFANELATSMLYPVIPIFLAATLGAPYAAIGLVEGAADAVTAGLQGASGWAGDRFGRKKQLVMLGYLLSALAKPALGLAFGWPLVLGARVLDRLGKGLRSAPRDAMIADAAAPNTRGRAFGFHSAADTAGGVVGPLFALGLIAWLGEANLRPIFVLALLPCLGAVALMALTRDRAPAAGPPRAATPARLIWTRPLVGFFALSVLFGLANSSDAFLILRARDLGLSTSLVIVAYVVYNVVYTLLATPAGDWSDRVGRKPAYVLGLLIFAVVYAGFALAGGSAWVWPLFAVYGAYIALTDGVGKALLTDLAPKDSRGTVLGMYQLALGLSALVASVLAGALWDTIGAPAPFWLGAGGALVAALLLLALPLRPAAAAAAP